MKQPYLHTQSFNRTNLTYFVKKKSSSTIKEIADIIRGRSRNEQSGIIYCFSKLETEKVCEALQKELPAMKSQITFYHADVPPAQVNNYWFLCFIL
jgi:bloom syndrome protein